MPSNDDGSVANLVLHPTKVLHLITEVSRHQGPVLIHCNSGHHRSVLAVAILGYVLARHGRERFGDLSAQL